MDSECQGEKGTVRVKVVSENATGWPKPWVKFQLLDQNIITLYNPKSITPPIRQLAQEQPLIQ